MDSSCQRSYFLPFSAFSFCPLELSCTSVYALLIPSISNSSFSERVFPDPTCSTLGPDKETLEIEV